MTPARAEALTRSVVFVTALAVADEDAAALKQARASLNVLIANKEWNLAAFAQALAASKLKVFASKEGRLSIIGAVVLADAAGRDVDLGNTEYIEAIIKGAEAGLTLAIGDGI